MTPGLERQVQDCVSADRGLEGAHGRVPGPDGRLQRAPGPGPRRGVVTVPLEAGAGLRWHQLSGNSRVRNISEQNPGSAGEPSVVTVIVYNMTWLW